MIVIPHSAFPLTWPAGIKRTPPVSRRESAFARRELNSHGFRQRYARTINDGTTKIRDELRRLGARTVVISSDLQLRSDGLPYSGQNPDDVGVAVYWTRNELQRDGTWKLVPYCMPCDRWNRIADNMYAIGMSIEALRGMERWGCVSVEQAFAGFAALPAGDSPAPDAARPRRSWAEVLEVVELRPLLAAADLLAIVKQRHRERIKLHHPDAGGDPAIAAELNAALAEAERELGGHP